MDRIIRIFVISIFWWTCLSSYSSIAYAQDVTEFIDPFIGTAKAKVLTRWGGEGGTYPGAVVPWGYVQLTPETRVFASKGYNYEDDSIYYFSCINHLSGYPNGSSGNVFVMPVDQSESPFELNRYSRKFRHSDETASAGYYSVLFPDNNTRVEATATTRTGFFRCSFPPDVLPQVFIGDIGAIKLEVRCCYGEKFNALIQFNKDILKMEVVEGGAILTFDHLSGQETVICIKVSASGVSERSSLRNLEVEQDSCNFDDMKARAIKSWEKVLSVISIDDDHVREKRTFYTALYHSLLLPWVISDVDGLFRGGDGKVHQAKDKIQYGAFSPWDTFRTLHPLLSLLFPDIQGRIVGSMLDVFTQTGSLPVGPMTGNHAIPVIVDSYLKGVPGIDSVKAYNAMKISLEQAALLNKDMRAYRKAGYVPSSLPESVTCTVEYAYNDWALAHFTGKVMHKTSENEQFLQGGYNYHNLIDTDRLFLLPRKDSIFTKEPGSFGYKEGDKWIYTYFVPHYPVDLINRLGGSTSFNERLDWALRTGCIAFDNEPVLHVPYFFNMSGRPDRTQYWVHEIMKTHYLDLPEGLPGNDDLGSMSSWYVFSALGVFPFCPGNAEYTIGSPVFKSVTIHLQNGKTFQIKRSMSAKDGYYLQSLKLNGEILNRLSISHSSVLDGGELVFEMGHSPSGNFNVVTNPQEHAVLEIIDFSVSKKIVLPNENFWCLFSLENHGRTGAYVAKLLVDGKETEIKNVLVKEGSAVRDSISCRLYKPGKAKLRIGTFNEVDIEVVLPENDIGKQYELKRLAIQPMFEKGKEAEFCYEIKNIGGVHKVFSVPVKINGELLKEDNFNLEPGEQRIFRGNLPALDAGLYQLEIETHKKLFKVYENSTGASLFDLAVNETMNGIVPDRSGLRNDGELVGTFAKDAPLQLGDSCFIELTNASDITISGKTLTMMAWVFPTVANSGPADIFCQGDFNVLQIQGTKNLNFFAGGWGRGECMAKLPVDWLNNWHHIAGICDGNNLKIFIDGELQAETKVADTESLRSPAKWTIGRNEEFPGERIFYGQVDRVKLLSVPLTTAEISMLYSTGFPGNENQVRK